MRLVDLYPAAWRTRYEAEFLVLLPDRPARGLEVVDIVLGAIGTRLNPQLIGNATSAAPDLPR
jgi:hypothetical protein